MRGLLEKDIRLLLQARTVTVVLVMAAMIVCFMPYQQEISTFILSYVPFMGTMLMIGTISYDEAENGYQFLMTLPIVPKDYVREKYLFCISGTFLAWLAAGGFYFLSMASHGAEIVWLEEMPLVHTFLSTVIMMLACMIPLKLKYESEKSRMILLGSCGVLLVVVYLLAGVLPEKTWSGLSVMMNGLGNVQLMLLEMAAAIIAIVISYLVSCKIMQKKEY